MVEGGTSTAPAAQQGAIGGTREVPSGALGAARPNHTLLCRHTTHHSLVARTGTATFGTLDQDWLY